MNVYEDVLFYRSQRGTSILTKKIILKTQEMKTSVYKMVPFLRVEIGIG
jgi:hypothetical protein